MDLFEVIKKRYSVFIFDFDYTLADATPGIVSSVNYALSQLGIETKSCDEIKKTVGMTLADCFYLLTGKHDDQLKQQFDFHFRDMADKIMTDNTVLFDDTIKILSQLKYMDYKTAIVTSKLHYRIDDVLRKYNIPELIDYIVGFEDVNSPKPSPEGLLKAIEYFTIDKNSVLYIGDSLIDANTAANASVDFAAVLTGTTVAKEFETLPYICIANNLTELMAYISDDFKEVSEKNMNIRKMTINDYEQVYSLWLNIPNMGLNNIDDSKEGIEKYLARNPETCFVAERNSSIVGVILSGHDGRRGFIYHLAVAQSEQRQGIGKILVDTAMSALEKEGISKIAFVVFEKNEKGNAFWENQGFTVRKDLVYRNKAIVELSRIDT